jgi:hypothetical protein
MFVFTKRSVGVTVDNPGASAEFAGGTHSFCGLDASRARIVAQQRLSLAERGDKREEQSMSSKVFQVDEDWAISENREWPCDLGMMDTSSQITNYNTICVAVVKRPRPDGDLSFILQAAWLNSVSRDGKSAPSLGIVLSIPARSGIGRDSVVANGLDAGPNGLAIPPGGFMGILRDYSGPGSDLRRPDAIVLAIAFPSPQENVSLVRLKKA